MASARPSAQTLAQLRRARDLIDRDYARLLTVPEMAARAFMSPAHFTRQFAAAYGETPHAYLMTRRVERAMALLRAGATVTEAAAAVGAASLGSFSSAFTRLVGMPPSAYRNRPHDEIAPVPACTVRLITRPTRPARGSSRIGEADAAVSA